MATVEEQVEVDRRSSSSSCSAPLEEVGATATRRWS